MGNNKNPNMVERKSHKEKLLSYEPASHGHAHDDHGHGHGKQIDYDTWSQDSHVVSHKDNSFLVGQTTGQGLDGSQMTRLELANMNNEKTFNQLTVASIV